MPRPSSLYFADRDLRNRCFRQQNLSGADFRRADLRGCDFRGAQLRSANFEAARTGQTRQQLFLPLGITGIAAIVMLDALSHLLFGVLGRTAAEPDWSFVIALSVSLAIVATAIWLPQPCATLLSGTTTSALLSFYYGGRAAGNDARMAIVSAILGGIVGLIVLWVQANQRRLFVAPVFACAAIAADALALFAGTWAIAAAVTLSWHNLQTGVMFTLISLVYFAIALMTLIRLVKIIRRVGGTSFHQADLTGAKFTNATLENADFSGAIGFAVSEFE